MLSPGDEIVITRLEHDANIAPWLALEERGLQVRWIDIHPEDMTLDLEGAASVIGPRTRLLGVGLASNAFGTVNDVAHLARLAHAHGAWVFVDAVHFAPHGPIDVAALECDLLACSAYKFFGPHLGILWGRFEVLSTVPSYHVRPAGDDPPDSWETGTLSHESLAGLLGTYDYLCSMSGSGENRRSQLRASMTAIRGRESALTRRLVGGLHSIPGVTVYGITDERRFDRRVPTASFLVDGLEPEVGARSLGEQGIFSWAGNHYALEPMGRLGLGGTQRVGLAHYNTEAEVDRFLEAVAGLRG
jgi:cysteine desulfurase family protein (TIGR01976 family)